MPVTYKDLPKGVVYALTKMFPKQSERVRRAVIKELDEWKGEWRFDAFMRKLFYSKDILLRTGYYHLNIQVKKHTT